MARGKITAERRFERQYREMEDGAHIVHELVDRVKEGEDLDQEDMEQLEEYGGREAFQAGLVSAYVKEMQEGTEALFYGDTYAPGTEKAQEYQENAEKRAEQYEWLSEDYGVSEPNIPEEEYEKAQEQYERAEEKFHHASHIESYLDEEWREKAREDLENEYAVRPKFKTPEQQDVFPRGLSPGESIRRVYDVFKGLKQIVRGEYRADAFTQHPEEHEKEAEERQKHLEEQVSAMRQELESSHADIKEEQPE